MSERPDSKQPPTERAEQPRNLKDIKPHQAQFWLIRFKTTDNRVELIESRFQHAATTPEVPCGAAALRGSDVSRDALCIAAIKARWQIARDPDTAQQIEIERTTDHRTYAGTLSNMLSKAPAWGPALFGGQGEKRAMDWTRVKPISVSRFKIGPETGTTARRNQKQPKRKKKKDRTQLVCFFAWGGAGAEDRLRIFVGGEDAREAMREVTTPDALLKLAADLEDQHCRRWPNPLVERPPESRTVELDAAALKRHQWISPPERGLLLKCRDMIQGTLSRKSGDFNKLFPAKAPFAQLAVAQAHLDVATWLKQHGQWNDKRPNRTAMNSLQSIATGLGLPPPLLDDLAFEMHQLADPLPPLQDGYSAFPLREGRETVALRVPLLEPDGDLKPGEPLRLRPFLGWLRIETVPVREWEDGSRVWAGGHVYGAPVFELLDQDEHWRAAIRAAVEFVNSCRPPAEALRLPPGFGVRQSSGALAQQPTGLKAAEVSRTPTHPRARSGQSKAGLPDQSQIENRQSKMDCDFRWSLARTDGGVLPPILLGNHLGAAFALALGKLAGFEPFQGLDFRGAVLFGAIAADGGWTEPGYKPELFAKALAEAGRAGQVAVLLTGSDAGWPAHWPR